jgi:hypothetical protein
MPSTEIKNSWKFIFASVRPLGMELGHRVNSHKWCWLNIHVWGAGDFCIKYDR